ncbi:hypothetical protein CSB93_0727 [Pseudomonas paraeruginosa]|uniref:Uncharacterized protein n=1 Tax=Pseudomonas paraeruginosa TaxID=2994495 RepID=A0A2R3IRI8_9PSED|nr:hypothetical protein CSB93_0727 [Pseudomonas paraeruginosa]AWE94653.1 hypothetical protein CSC28_6041 [Pseudomonas paraeruginosa]
MGLEAVGMFCAHSPNLSRTSGTFRKKKRNINKNKAIQEKTCSTTTGTSQPAPERN